VKQALLRDGVPSVVEVAAPGPREGYVLVATAASVISSGTERTAVVAHREAAADGPVAGSAPVRLIRNPALARKAMSSVRDEGVRATIQKARGRGPDGGPAPSHDEAMGYSCAGWVLDTGGHPELVVGELVACAGAAIAAHAEVVSVPANLVAPVPAGVDPADAAFTTLGAIAMQGVRRADATLGETVAVVGLGLLGLITVQLLRASGARVIGIEPRADRRELAETLGAELTVEPAEAARRMGELTGGEGVDVALITAASSSDAILNDSVRLLRRKGRAVIVGAVGLGLERPDLYRREADVLISTSYGPGRYDPTYEEGGLDYPIAYVRWTENRNMREFLRLLSAGSVAVEPLVGGRFALAEAPTAYDRVAGDDPPMAVVLDYDATGPPTGSERLIRNAAAGPVIEAPVGIALIGAGGFVRGMHLPNIEADERIAVRTVVNRTGVSAGNVARAVGAALASTDPAEAFADPEIDLVVIGTRHDTHAELAAAALRAGKAVFVEKPLGLTRDEIDDVRTAAADNPRLAIGFNRPFAPLAVQLAEELHGVEGPAHLVYRVNAPLARDHWLNDPVVGGGRILGEACHMIDFANSLLGAPLRVHAIALPAPGDGGGVDTATITIAYPNGCHATIHYSGAGAGSMSKERIEAFRGGRSWLLDDFTRLVSYEGSEAREQLLEPVDKGHAALLDGVIAATLGMGPFEPGIDAAYAAQATALAALESLSSGSVVTVQLAAERS
jgi:predicted dehydrogenase/threonine dehydrogenase-like Zn-dependent dehydrogenase